MWTVQKRNTPSGGALTWSSSGHWPQVFVEQTAWLQFNAHSCHPVAVEATEDCATMLSTLKCQGVHSNLRHAVKWYGSI